MWYMRSRFVVGGVGALLFVLTLGTSVVGAVVGRKAPVMQEADPGAMVFQQNCAICHGVKAQGRLGPPLNQLPPEIAALSPEEIATELTQLLRGGIPGAMPRFLPEQISDAQVVDLTRYLVSLNNTLPSPSFYEAAQPVEASAVSGRTYFPQTQHSVGGEFLTFWQRYGGLRVFGLPLTEEYNGISPENGQMYRMQLFERARFEYHPDMPTGQRIQLALIGAEESRLRSHFLMMQGEQGEGQGPPPSQP